MNMPSRKGLMTGDNPFTDRTFKVRYMKELGVFVDAQTIYTALREKYPDVNFQVKMVK